MDFPMPNTQLDGKTVIASVWYTDIDDREEATVLLLNESPPFFRIAVVDIKGDQARFIHTEDHMNIVPAVDSYQQWGGDY